MRIKMQSIGGRGEGGVGWVPCKRTIGKIIVVFRRKVMDITCIVVYNMLLKMFNKYNPVVNEVILEIICITSRLHWSCSIIDVRKAIVFFTADRKSKNFEILTREWKSSIYTSFYLRSTTLKTSFGAQSFGTLSLILRERKFIKIPVYQIWLKVTAWIKTKTSQRHSSKLAQPQNLELQRKLNIFCDISLDVESLFGAPFYFLADWKLLFQSIFFLVICGGKKPQYFHWGVFYIQ